MFSFTLLSLNSIHVLGNCFKLSTTMSTAHVNLEKGFANESRTIRYEIPHRKSISFLHQNCFAIENSHAACEVAIGS